MSKLSASNNYVDETVRSELSRGGYVTANDEVALPNYMVYLSSQNYFIMEMNVE